MHFMVSGFQQIVVYDPGTKPEDIVVPSSGTFINDLTNVFYLGIPPQGGPPPGTPPTTNPFNGSNRQESPGASRLRLTTVDRRLHNAVPTQFGQGAYPDAPPRRGRDRPKHTLKFGRAPST